MHLTQKKILNLLTDEPLKNVSMRQVGRLVGVDHPQMIKHHLEQLEIKGLAKYDSNEKTLTSLRSTSEEGSLLTLPVYGSATCGQASDLAEDNMEGYIKISKSLISNSDEVIVLRASGDSMNRSEVNGEKSIDDGDYVIIDTKQKSPENKDYIVSIIDGMANIKRFILDKENKQIVLMSESTKNYPPIFIGEDELGEYSICGKVIQVIKKPNY